MTVPGLQSCTTKYKVTRDATGKITNNSNTYDNWSAAKKNLSASTRANTFSSSSSVRTTNMYATGANSRLGKFGYEMGSDGRIRLNADSSDLRAGNGSGSVVRPIVINTGGNECTHTNKTSGLETATGIATLVAGGIELYNKLDESGAIDKAKEGIKDLFQKIPTSTGALSGALDSASSFSEISSLESQADAKKASMASDYQKIDISSKAAEALQQDGVQDGLKLAGVTLDTNALKLETLNPDDLDASANSVEKDMGEVEDFQQKDLTDAKAKISERRGAIDQGIESLNGQLERLEAQQGKEGAPANLDQQIADCKAKIEKLEKQKEQVDKAEDAVDQLNKDCTQLLTDLKAQQSAIKDLKEFEGEIKDKKYDLAKEQDGQLGKNMKEIDKLNKKMQGIKGNDDKDVQKREEISKEIAGLKSEMKTALSSLQDAGTTSFENSKGKKYEVKNMGNASMYISAGGDVAAGVVKQMVKDGTLPVDDKGNLDMEKMKSQQS